MSKGDGGENLCLYKSVGVNVGSPRPISHVLQLLHSHDERQAAVHLLLVS